MLFINTLKSSVYFMNYRVPLPPPPPSLTRRRPLFLLLLLLLLLFLFTVFLSSPTSIVPEAD